jgi:NAD+ synthase (glutamine-hydrolysing)
MQHLGITNRTVDIRSMALAEWRALGHSPLGIDTAGLDLPGFQARLDTLAGERKSDLIFENVQARLRTSLLMNSGFVLGTGDLSESALGWCTYNGDHMSMYNVNAGVPKTLVRFLVAWAAQNEFEGESRRCLLDIVATPISPELLPPRADGTISQTTEESVGPYELHDFFLFHLLRHGADPAKIMLLARHAHFDNLWSVEDIRKWLKIFLTRFFAQQYKRDCVPNGPKIGSVSLSPRGDWRMPSDAIAKAWLDRLDG